VEFVLHHGNARSYPFAYRAGDRELSVAAFLKWFKRWFNESYGAREEWRWQPGGFDRLLRTSESVHEKWNYIRENPVRAGLVACWKEWPYQKGFADDE
jgi:hypothetical protein